MNLMSSSRTFTILHDRRWGKLMFSVFVQENGTERFIGAFRRIDATIKNTELLAAGRGRRKQ